jgi:hypothetical protein
MNRTTRMVPCYTCLDQSFPIGTAGLTQNNTPDHQSTTHRLYSITKHQHIGIQTIIHEANKKIQLEHNTNSRKIVQNIYKTILHIATITQT